jgi:tetratricopeptide (TPR) repeat protein
MQVKFDEALPIYEEAHKQKKSDNIIVGMLTDLTYDMQKYQKCLNYVNLFLKENPRNVDKMFIKSECLEVLQQNNKKSMSEIINMYNKILELQPYNTKARDKLKGLLEK